MTTSTTNTDNTDRYVILHTDLGWTVRDTVTSQYLADRDGNEDFASFTDAHDLLTEYANA